MHKVIYFCKSQSLFKSNAGEFHVNFYKDLNIIERVKYKLGVITRRRCLYGSAPRYLAECCVPVSTTASRQHPRSTASHQLVIPAYNIWSSGLFSSRSDVLELAAQKLA